MRFQKLFAVLVSAIIVFSVMPTTVFSAWLHKIDPAVRTFKTTEGGTLEICPFDTNGNPMCFYQLGTEYVIDAADQQETYIAEGLQVVGDRLAVSEETARVSFDPNALGYFKAYDRARSGYVLYSYTDETCGCTIYVETEDDATMITPDMPEYIEVVFLPTGETADPTAPPTADGIKMTLNGAPVAAEAPPYIENGRTMVPMRFISEALGASVGWEGSTGLVTVKVTDGSVFRLNIGKNGMAIVSAAGDTTTVTMDTPPVIKDGRTFVPVKYVAEALGLVVDWNGATQTVLLTKK